jgi:long-chain acyl-CoA synthetase
MINKNLNRIWLSEYPDGVPSDIEPERYNSLVELFEESFEKFAPRVAYDFMDKEFTYKQVDDMSLQLATYLQSLGLTQGARIGVMLPNIPQFPISASAVLRGGFIQVNVNPLYTARELEKQFNDSGIETVFILENFASVLEKALPNTSVKNIIMCSMGDLLGCIKGSLVNFVVRRVKKMVPAYSLPKMILFNDALKKEDVKNFVRPVIKPEDTALLQYTGGTTGLPKGAVLSHRNVIANVLQSAAWDSPAMHLLPSGQQAVLGCALPLYHIFAFTVNMILGMRDGAKTILIPNPRDIPATLKALSKHRINLFPAVNTLFNAMANHPDFQKVDWSDLKVSLGGGMAVQGAVAKLWLEKTGCSICEGYGLSETSPSVCCNIVTSKEYTGTIGVPIPSTYMKILDESGVELPIGEAGEIAIKGPQVMSGYWNRPEETAACFTSDGYFLTGDIGTMDARGYFKVVDRKKDMILVSGFNVYPNEIEELVSAIPGVLECACIGVPYERSGEAVKLFIVKKDASLTEDAVKKYCKENLTGYKNPKFIEFRTELPKTPVGKILRRALKE